jgi:predicted O-methyltransferase YrrM
MLKKLLSYLMPVNIYQKKSAVSRNLEITWNNGQLVLDSQNTNYSYGSLQRILRKGLKKIGFEKITAMNDILVLGVAGGSVIKTLADEIEYKGRITGVEIDAEIIQIANDYFRINEIPNLEIVIADAFEFVFKTKKRFDLIIIDIFQDITMPEFLFDEKFINQLGIILNNNGFILFNTMVLSEAHNNRNKKYLSAYDQKQFTSEKLARIEKNNELIIVEKSIL